MFFIMVISILTGLISEATCDEESEYLDINDLFPSFNELPPSDDGPPELYRNITIDVEKLDLNKFKEKMDGELHKNVEEDFKSYENDSARRFAIYFKVNEEASYRRGVTLATNLVGTDIILQMIYMAKSQMVAIETNTFFDTTNTAYRVGFLGFKMKKEFTKLVKIYTYMRKYAYSFYEMRGHIVLHHRAVKLHVDLLYYHWVLTVLDGIYRDRFGDKYKPKLVSGEEATGGISIEAKKSLIR